MASKRGIWNALELADAVEDFSARGGATIAEVNEKLVVFGGADRGLTHFADLAICRKSVVGPSGKLVWRREETSGDIPQPRSGHAVAVYGKFMFLFGGIDFSEEAVFNDLYIFDSDTFEWKYVGESGAEVPERNSHSLEVVSMTLPLSVSSTQTLTSNAHSASASISDITIEVEIPTSEPLADAVNFESASIVQPPINELHFLVLFGGASPELGPLDDTYIAALPLNPEDMSESTFFVSWQRLTNGDICAQDRTPAGREMHSSVGCRNTMTITGGRNESGILRDSWSLELFGVDSGEQQQQQLTSSRFSIVGIDGLTVVASASWHRRRDLELSLGRCAHSGILIKNNLYVLGGFREDGMICDGMTAFNNESGQNDKKVTSVSSSTGRSEIKLETMTGTESLGGRFSMAACLAPKWLIGNVLSHVSAHPAPRTIFSTTTTAGIEMMDSCKCGIVVFGGVTTERDYNDVWLLIES